MLKGQDLVVLAALLDSQRGDESYAELGRRTCISASEAHAAVRRLRESSLIAANWHVLKHNALEFLLHGLRYAFPAVNEGGFAKGMPTSYAAPVADGVFAVSGEIPVWQTSCGDACGRAISPLYPTVPDAASKDRGLYDRLAVFDMLRAGRLRERQFAEQKLMEMLP